MKVVAFLPAKGHSERVQNKNLKLLCGKPLFLHTLEKLASCDFIDEVYLDSESDLILNWAPYLRYISLKRDPSLANNKTDGHQLFYNEVKQVDADIYIQILGTSPFIKKETILRGINILKENPEYDSVALVRKDKQYTWNNKGPMYDKNHIPNSKDLPDTIIETMGMYIVRSEVAHKNKQRLGEHVYLLEAEPIESVDIDTPADFYLAECVMKGQQYDECMKFKGWVNFLSSSMLSDVLANHGINTSIKGMRMNLPNKKIFGRANTLKIRSLKENEDYRGIYKGLETYNFVRTGEIIVVDTEVPNRAYFGELNANLAIRSGAIGTIVNGYTRDINEVTKLDYPVFSKGYNCADVRCYGTIESHGQPVVIEGVEIKPGDLVFADINGVVVIPSKYEEIAISEAIEVIKKEKEVLNKILQNFDASQIYQITGEF